MKKIIVLLLAVVIYQNSYSTSQWSRKFNMSCSSCHLVFPRLNSFGDEFLKNGYQLESTYKKNWEDGYAIDAGGVKLSNVDDIFGFRLNITPFKLETNSFQKDSGSAKENKITLANTDWIQFFVAGSIYKDVSFFTELEHTTSGFKTAWFYFNLTNILDSKLINFQIGRITPLEWASFPNRLPQLPAIKSEAMLIKSSDGKGDQSLDLSSVRPGVMYYGRTDDFTLYAGLTPGTEPANKDQFIDYWAGVVYKLPESISSEFGGSTVTLHYYSGTDTKNTGITSPDVKQIENNYTRISPQVNIRWNNKLDLQAAYILGTDANRSFLTSGYKDFNFTGIGVQAGYLMNEKIHLAMHFDQYESEDLITSGYNKDKPVFEFMRVVPVATYIINENIRVSAYYEKNLTADRFDTAGKKIDLVDKFYLNTRIMF